MKKAKPQVTTTTADPATLAYQQKIRDAATAAGNQPYTPYGGQTVAGTSSLSPEGVAGMQNARDQYGNLYNANLGLGDQYALQGNHAAQQMNGLADQYGQAGADAQSRMYGQADQYGAAGTAARDRMYGQADQYGRQGAADQAEMQRFAGGLDPYRAAGNTGAAALGGSRSAQQNLYNPYESGVVDATSAQFDKMRSRATLQANDAAQASGAFGGSRHGIAEGARLGELDAGEGSTLADLRYRGFNDMMGNAGAAANLGLGAAGLQQGALAQGQGSRQGYAGLQNNANQAGINAEQGFAGLQNNANQAGINANQGYAGLQLGAAGQGQQIQQGYGQMQQGALNGAGNAAAGGMDASQNIFNAGDYFRQIQQQQLDDQHQRFNEARDWDVRNLGILNSGLGQSGSQTTTPQTRNAAAGLLGGAASGMAIGGPIGAGVGGLLGLFG